MIRRLAVASPDLALAGVFLYAWLHPFALGEQAVPFLFLTMLLEFIILHSAAFMGNVLYSDESTGSRVRMVLGFGLFYTLFVGGFAMAFEVWWPFFAFWGLILNRLLGVVLGDAPRGKEEFYVRAGWALGVMYYLFAVTVTLLTPLPELGLTRTARDALSLPGSGQWVDEPYRVLAFGVLYFGLHAVGELLGWARNERFLQGVPGYSSRSSDAP